MNYRCRMHDATIPGITLKGKHWEQDPIIGIENDTQCLGALLKVRSCPCD